MIHCKIIQKNSTFRKNLGRIKKIIHDTDAVPMRTLNIP